MSARHSQGFTLIEALVTIVIVAVGLLGLLALQSVAIVHTQNASARTLASIAVDDLIDRMRANSTARGATDEADATQIYANITPGNSAADAVSGCTNAPCSPKAMALLDAHEWQQRIREALPDGRGFVACLAHSATSPSHCQRFEIVVAWHERDAPGATPASPDTQCPTSRTRSNVSGFCYVLPVEP